MRTNDSSTSSTCAAKTVDALRIDLPASVDVNIRGDQTNG
jgi:hypothetical protein